MILFADSIVDGLLESGFPETVLRFIDRLHPLFVHFPVALLVVAAALEFLRFRGRDHCSPTALVCILIAAPMAILSVVSGWLNAEMEPHSRSMADILEYHRWFGVSVAITAVISAIGALSVKAGLEKARVFYRAFLIMSALLVMIGGHLGATMVYGDDYISEVFEHEAPAPESDPSGPQKDSLKGDDPDTSDASDNSDRGNNSTAAEPDTTASHQQSTEVVGGQSPEPTSQESDVSRSVTDVTLLSGEDLYQSVIQPLFESRCYSCHGPEKQKGKLRLDRMEDLLSGDRDSWLVVPGDANASILFELISLPADDADIMPAKGDPLTSDQIASIRRWIDGGAWPLDSGVAAPAKPPAEIPAGKRDSAVNEDTARRAESESKATLVSRDLNPAEQAAIQAIQSRGGLALRMGENDIDLEVSFRSARVGIGDGDLSLLSPLNGVLARLDLGRTAITDKGIKKLRGFRNLRRLHLEETSLSDEGLDFLVGLEALEYLNLHSTGISDQGARKLVALPRLRKVFLWNTNVTLEGKAQLLESCPDLVVDLGEAVAVTHTPTPEVVVEKSAACCDRATAEGLVCDHPCCVEAAALGNVCPKCSS